MIILALTTISILMRASVLLLRTSLPFQAFSLFFIRVSIAMFSGRSLSPLIGIYIVLIYSSGLLVLLAYFVALSPNQTLNAPPLNLTFSFLLSFIAFLSFTFMASSRIQLPTLFSRPSTIISILAPSSLSLLLMIGLVLILTIITVIKILRLRSKPIRP